MHIVREFFEFEENLYEVLRTIKETHSPNLDEWKQKLGADKVLKKGIMEGAEKVMYLYFCRKVEDAVIITDDEIKVEQNKEEQNG